MVSYGVIGVGSIAESIVTGLCQGVDDPPAILLSPRSAERSARLAAQFPSVRVAADNQAVVDASDVVVVCVLPDQAAAVLPELRWRPDQAVVSAVAGISVSRLLALVAPVTDVARSIPVPAVASRTSITPVHPATPAARALYAELGGVMALDDELAYESVAAASATVAAYFTYLQTIGDWLAEHGVDAAEARPYVARRFAELTDELQWPGADFAAMAAAHTTVGGLNEQFARHLRDSGTFGAVRTGLDEVLARLVPEG